MLSIAKTRVLADVDQLIEKHGFALTDIYYREAWLEGIPTPRAAFLNRFISPSLM
jgi:hypothetical protein